MDRDKKDFLKKKKKLGQQAKGATATDLRFRTRGSLFANVFNALFSTAEAKN
jgi:hypothetical protein